jgi:hypothetical protein
MARPVRTTCPYAAISRSTSGCSSATRMSVFAAPLGARRPCSHCSNVRCDTPRRVANCACVRPDLRRARATGERGSSKVRLARPALISFTPSKTSCQMSRLASKLASARAQFVSHFRMLPSAFSGCGRARSPAWSSRTASAQVPTPPEPGTTVPAPGLNIGKFLQFSVFVIIEVVGVHAIKRARLNKREH